VLLPVNLWREIREDDVVELMKLRGVVVPLGDRLYKYREDLAKRYLDEVLKQIETLSEVSVERQTPFGVIKLSKRIATITLDVSFRDRRTYAKALRKALLQLLEVREMLEDVRKELEKEAEEKARLLKRISAVLEKYPQRSKFIQLEKLDERDVRKEEAIAQKADEALKIWAEIKHMVKALNMRLDVESDLATLLELPEPWLEDYLANLKLHAAEIARRYEKYIEQERIKKVMAEWLEAKFGVTGDLDKALSEVAQRLNVDRRLLEAVARRGRGAVLDVDELSKETGLDKARVEEELEKLYKAGAVEKKYVA
jgi:DNA-binding transcriptional ArsR family regulator